MLSWIALAGAITFEVSATLALRQLAAGWSPVAALMAIAGYVSAFALLLLALRQLNVGAAYAIWSGLGTVGISVAGILLFGEHVSLPSAAGIGLIVAGVVVLQIAGPAHA